MDPISGKIVTRKPWPSTSLRAGLPAAAVWQSSRRAPGNIRTSSACTLTPSTRWLGGPSGRMLVALLAFAVGGRSIS